MKMNQRGFTLVEGLLLGILAALVAGVGYFVYDSNKKEPQVSAPTVQQTSTTQEAKEEDSWKLVESAHKAFKIRIPDGWGITTDLDGDFIFSTTEDLTYTKGNAVEIKTVEGFGTDAPLRFTVSANNENNEFFGPGEKTKFVLNNGVEGSRSYRLETSTEEGLGPVKGEKDYEYDFSKNGKYFQVIYRILPGDTDNLEIVEKAIKTLEF